MIGIDIANDIDGKLRVWYQDEWHIVDDYFEAMNMVMNDEIDSPVSIMDLDDAEEWNQWCDFIESQYSDDPYADIDYEEVA